jgi:hypothetical protein
MCSNCREYEDRPRGLPTRGSHDYTSLWRERPEGPTQIERLDYPKGALLTGEDKLQAYLAAVYSVYLIHAEVKGSRA